MGVAYYKQKTKEELQDIVNNSNTWQEVMYNLGYTANRDNRIENLRLLCPNCHSQTETFSGKNATRYLR